MQRERCCTCTFCYSCSVHKVLMCTILFGTYLCLHVFIKANSHEMPVSVSVVFWCVGVWFIGQPTYELHQFMAEHLLHESSVSTSFIVSMFDVVIQAHTHTHTQTHTHTHMHANTHTHTHICTDVYKIANMLPNLPVYTTK